MVIRTKDQFITFLHHIPLRYADNDPFGPYRRTIYYTQFKSVRKFGPYLILKIPTHPISSRRAFVGMITLIRYRK